MKDLLVLAKGVLLPLFGGRIVSGVPEREPCCMVDRTPSRVGRGPFHVLRAIRATRWHTPFGGTVPGNALNGVTVGSCKYFMYVIQR